MYIKELRLKNIRGFRDLHFGLARPGDRCSGWTVFTGDNGSGKSTLLKAIAIGLVGKDTAHSLQPDFQRWIRDGAGGEESSIELDLVRCSDDDALADSGKAPSRPFPVKLALRNGGKETTIDVVPPEGTARNYSTPKRTVWAADARGWFSCGYGPFRRMFGASPEAMRHMVSPSTERYVTMFQEAASLTEVDLWLRDLKHKALEGKENEQRKLDLVVELLRDDLMPNQITVERVDSDGLWLRDRHGVLLGWNDMSEGYRAATALLTDILRHLIAAYGMDSLTGRDDSGKVFIQRSGVVLIDEIDAHLHPEWQREIGFWLKRHFPKIQFLVTTHSPLICQAADENGLFVLPEPGSDDDPRALSAEEYRRVIASKPDTILLTPAFGLQNTRSPVAVEKRAEISRLEAKKRAGARLTSDEQLEFDKNGFYVTNEEEL